MSKKKRHVEEDPIKRFDVVLPVATDAQILKWNVKEGGDVLEGQELCAYQPLGAARDYATPGVQFLRSPFPFEGVIRHLHPEKTPLSAGCVKKLKILISLFVCTTNVILTRNILIISLLIFIYFNNFIPLFLLRIIHMPILMDTIE